jgi:ABC-type transporter Mla subunit MlaD
MTKTKGMEVRAGIVILAGIVIGLIGLFLVSGGFDALKKYTNYTILFSDAGGISEGSDVFLAGQRVGKVLAIEDRFAPNKEGIEQNQVAVTVKIYEDKVLNEDSEITISISVTNVVKLNMAYGTGKRATSSSRLYGKKLPTFEEILGDGRKTLAEIDGAVKDARGAIKKIDGIIEGFQREDLPKQATALMTSLRNGAADFELILADARQPVQDILGDLKTTVAQAEEDLGVIGANVKDASANVKDASADVKIASADIKAVIQENRNDFRAIVQNIKDASRRAGPALEQAERMLRGADKTIEEVRPRLVAAMESAKRALANFEDVTEDLKTSPWKVLNKPSDTEYREIHLYNSLGRWTQGIRDVQGLVQRLDALRVSGALEDPSQAERVQGVLDAFERAVTNYDRAWHDVQQKILAIRDQK